jgi:hypothetical protein
MRGSTKFKLVCFAIQWQSEQVSSPWSAQKNTNVKKNSLDLAHYLRPEPEFNGCLPCTELSS